MATLIKVVGNNYVTLSKSISDLSNFTLWCLCLVFSGTSTLSLSSEGALSDVWKSLRKLELSRYVGHTY